MPQLPETAPTPIAPVADSIARAIAPTQRATIFAANSPANQLSADVLKWAPALSKKELFDASTALGLEALPLSLGERLQAIVGRTCLNILDVSLNGAEKNIRGAIRRMLKKIAKSSAAAAESVRYPRFGIMSAAQFALDGFLTFQISVEGGDTCYAWVAQAQNIAGRLVAIMPSGAGGPHRDLVMYEFAELCVSLIHLYDIDSTLPSRDLIGDYAIDDPGPLMSISRHCATLVSSHGAELARTLAGNQAIIDKTKLAVAKDLFQKFAAVSDFSLHRYLSQTKRAPRLQRPVELMAIEFIHKAAQQAGIPLSPENLLINGFVSGHRQAS